MKQTPDMDRIQADMRPGRIAQDGFLGNETRKLGDIIEADEAHVRRLGVTHGQIAERMRELREKGKAGLGEPISVPPHFVVQILSVRGKMPCPFRDGSHRKTTIWVRDTRTGREVMFTDLGIHMIEQHGFYQGVGSPFRCDPDVLAEVFDLSAGSGRPAP